MAGSSATWPLQKRSADENRLAVGADRSRSVGVRMRHRPRRAPRRGSSFPCSSSAPLRRRSSFARARRCASSSSAVAPAHPARSRTRAVVRDRRCSAAPSSMRGSAKQPLDRGLAERRSGALEEVQRLDLLDPVDQPRARPVAAMIVAGKAVSTRVFPFEHAARMRHANLDSRYRRRPRRRRESSVAGKLFENVPDHLDVGDVARCAASTPS